MPSIHTCLWFDQDAQAAAQYYTSIFPNSAIEQVVPYGKAAAQASGQPEGSVMTVAFRLGAFRVLGLNGGPLFPFNPSMSFFVACDTEEEINALWDRLCEQTRIELQAYPFAKKYGWCVDRFGLDWQVILAPRAQKISPALLFCNKKYGQAESAVQFYISQFPHSKVDFIAHDEKTRAVLHASFTLAGQSFVATEGPVDRDYDFSPAMSFIVECDSQEEIDRVWGRLSAVPEAEQCGWLKDRYGVSWQVVPRDWGKTIAEAPPQEKERLMEAILKMKKPDLAALSKKTQGTFR